jgi:hypothetical protein
LIKMKTIYSILLTLFCFISCNKNMVEYFIYQPPPYYSDELINEPLVVIDYTSSEKKCDSKKYASQAICFRYSSCDTVRVLNLCSKYKHKKGNEVELSRSELIYCPKDTIFVAYDEHTKKYSNKNFKTYIGELFMVLH